MKKINLLFALGISLGIASCNNGSEKSAAAETKDTALLLLMSQPKLAPHFQWM